MSKKGRERSQRAGKLEKLSTIRMMEREFHDQVETPDGCGKRRRKKSDRRESPDGKRRRELLETMRSAGIRVRFIAREKLYDEAVASYNARNGTSSAPEDLSEDFLDRIAVNYIRHRLTTYNRKIGLLREREGQAEAYMVLAGRTFRMIAMVYPFLAHECEKQLALKFAGLED